MKRFKIEQSTADIVSQSGLALIGQVIHRYTTLNQELHTQAPLRQGTRRFVEHHTFHPTLACLADIIVAGIVVAGDYQKAVRKVRNWLVSEANGQCPRLPLQSPALRALNQC